MANNLLDQKLDIAGSVNQEQNLNISDEVLGLGMIVQSGAGAYISGDIISNLSGFTQSSVGRYIQISGTNSGSYKIIQVISAYQVQVSQLLIDDTNVDWIERNQYSLEDDLNYERTDRAKIKGVNYYDDIPEYVRPTATTTLVPANLANIASKTTDAKALITNRKFNNIEVSVGESYIIVFDIGNLKHSNNIDVTGIPIIDGYDGYESSYVEIKDGYGNSLFVQSGQYTGWRIFGLTREGASISPNSIEIEFKAVQPGEDISSSIDYIWESGQLSVIDLYYPYRDRLDLIDENALRVTLVNGLISPVGTFENHEKLDTLVHDLAEDGYSEVIYSGSKIVANIFWTNTNKEIKVREYLIEYSGNNVSKITSIQYNDLGTEVSRLVEDVFYSGNNISYILSDKIGEPTGGAFSGGADGYGLTETDHEKLRQLIHFIDEGPTQGFVSGAYKETIGGAFPIQEIWWTSSLKINKIVETNITRNAKQQPVIVEWKVYKENGSLNATVIDNIQYNGIFEESRARVIS